MTTFQVKPTAGTSRRNVFVNAAAIAVGSVVTIGAGTAVQAATPAKVAGVHNGSYISMKDGTQIYVKDWGTGPNTVVFSHGWPLSADAWEDQMLFLASNGYRCIAHDRRGHGRSSQPWDGNNYDTFADDLATIVNTLNVKNATFVGHSMGGGEVARYLGKHGSARASKAVLIAAVTPLMLKTAANPEGTPLSAFDGIRAGLQADRAQFYKDLTTPFFGFNRADIKDSQGRRDTFTTSKGKSKGKSEGKRKGKNISVERDVFYDLLILFIYFISFTVFHLLGCQVVQVPVKTITIVLKQGK